MKLFPPHRGIDWTEFPGRTRVERRMAFALWKQGVHQWSHRTQGLDGAALKARIEELRQQASAAGLARHAKKPIV